MIDPLNEMRCNVTSMPLLPDPPSSTPMYRGTAYLLLADNVWAKLYSAEYPFLQLKLLSHRINFVGRGFAVHSSARENDSLNHERTRRKEDFCRALSRLLKSEHQAGKFDCLVLMGSRYFLNAMGQVCEGECGCRRIERLIEVPGQLTEADLLALLRLDLQDAVAPDTSSPA